MPHIPRQCGAWVMGKTHYSQIAKKVLTNTFICDILFKKNIGVILCQIQNQQSQGGIAISRL